MFGFRKNAYAFKITGRAPNPTFSLHLKKGKKIELKRKNRGYTKQSHD